MFRRSLDKRIEIICSAIDSGWRLSVRRHEGVWAFAWNDPNGHQRGWGTYDGREEMCEGKWHSLRYEHMTKKDLVREAVNDLQDLHRIDENKKKIDELEIAPVSFGKSDAFREWMKF